IRPYGNKQISYGLRGRVAVPGDQNVSRTRPYDNKRSATAGVGGLPSSATKTCHEHDRMMTNDQRRPAREGRRPRRPNWLRPTPSVSSLHPNLAYFAHATTSADTHRESLPLGTRLLDRLHEGSQAGPRLGGGS